MVEQGWSFTSRERVVGATTVVELGGEVDILAATALGLRLDEITGSGHPDLVLDVRGVTFIDCCGISMLCRARRRTQVKAGRLRLAGVAESPSVLRLLRLTGLLSTFDLCLDPGADPGADPVFGLVGEAGADLRAENGCPCTRPHAEGPGHPATPGAPTDSAVA
ncbi:anti-sigma factor antagonist [Streptomyces albofaciens JCM 4342]|uniref:STAS domain-containing protein n=1 Tax=Streptomyces albofaciens TaxID=66866 RepID=UPI00123AB191|nr:STAS domain-containing protein [Streptomyces albofaciens]KAA6223381.1 anti-sigma factor antagonist [Streptomyces albofaciens JCM 4342]